MADQREGHAATHGTASALDYYIIDSCLRKFYMG
jgi:hypothetical protein